MNSEHDLEHDSQVQEALDALTLNERAAAPPTPPTLIPWVVCGVAIVALLFTALYSRKVVSEANERAQTAERMRKDLQDRLAAGESGRKEDRARAVELAGKNEELAAQATELASRLKDKDAQLAGKAQADAVIFTRLSAIVQSAHGRGIAKDVEAVLPKLDPNAPPPAPVKPKRPLYRFPKPPGRH